MTLPRRDFLSAGTKFLFLTGAAGTALPYLLAGEPEYLDTALRNEARISRPSTHEICPYCCHRKRS